eukprot:8200235-Alexandrium_andersonii.AAC.1
MRWDPRLPGSGRWPPHSRGGQLHADLLARSDAGDREVLRGQAGARGLPHGGGGGRDAEGRHGAVGRGGPGRPGGGGHPVLGQ